MTPRTPADVTAAIQAFSNRVPELTLPEQHRYTFAELRDLKALRHLSWSRKPGIYTYFRGDESLCYVGRAMLSSGLANRVSDHVQDYRRGRHHWDVVLDDAGAFGVVYAFEPAAEVWIPSLEVFLIAQFTGQLVNRRRA